MKKLYIKDNIKYTGVQLSPHWIYKNFNIQGDAIVSFQGAVDVELNEMVDIEDVINNEPISSDKMLSFIIEKFETPLSEMVCIQRLFVSIIKETLEQYGINSLKREGDDIFYQGKKLSVSIATKSMTSCLIHTALNVVSTGAPICVSSFYDIGIQDVESFAETVMEKFIKELDDIKFAVTKVRGVM